MIHRIRPRRTRRSILTWGLLAAAAAAVEWRGAWANRRAPRRIESQFSNERPGDGWGKQWHCPLYQRAMRVEHGSATIEIPDGLHQAAPDQPTPVFLLDQDHTDGAQTLTFRVDREQLRPGLLGRASDTLTYVGVTIEGSELVIADYAAEGRTVGARGTTPPLAVGKTHHLEVRMRGRSLRARAWPDGTPTPGWQVTGTTTVTTAGGPGILLVQPHHRRRSTLAVDRHILSPETAVHPTRPLCAVAMSGIPRRRPDGTYDVRLRVWSAYPARVSYELSERPDMRGSRIAGGGIVSKGPLTALHRLVVPAGSPLYWRARLRSLTTGVETVSDVHSVTVARGNEPVTFAAASLAIVRPAAESRVPTAARRRR
jgi:hypothetical protein